jgi:hypothetical protein
MIKKLEPTERVTATRINQLIEDVERQTRITLGSGLVGTRSSAGTAIANSVIDPFPWRPDTDATAIMGRVQVGYNGTDSDAACFAHYDQMNDTDYALMQTAAGDTLLNAETGNEISFRINDAEQMQLNATDLRYVYGTAGVAYFGQAAVGYNGGGVPNSACFAYYTQMNSTDYALLQQPDGSTFLNAETGAEISFRINNVERMRLDGTDLRYEHKNNAVAYFGYAGIGYNGVDGTQAVFAHADCMNGTDYALKHSITGNDETRINVATAGSIALGVNDVTVAGVSVTGGIGMLYVEDQVSAFSDADVVVGEFVKRHSASTLAVVDILQDDLSGGIPCLELDQDDASEGFIDFVGSNRGAVNTGRADPVAVNSAASVRVELSGTKYVIPLFPDQ